MHFDQFNAVKKEKLYFFTIHPIFILASQTTNLDKSLAFFQIYWSIIVNQIHNNQILQMDLAWLCMPSWF